MNGISPEVADHRISLVQVQIVGEVDVPPFEPFHEVERLKGLSPPAGQDSIEWSPDFSRFARWAIRIWWQVQVVGVAVGARQVSISLGHVVTNAPFQKVSRREIVLGVEVDKFVRVLNEQCKGPSLQRSQSPQKVVLVLVYQRHNASVTPFRA